MINSIAYKLTKQPNTISEEVFEPNQNLLDFISEKEFNDSRILVIQASNSSGKSFLLNSIAYAFNALELSKEDLSPTLRRSINYLIDKEHQVIDFNININDPDGFSLESSFNHLGRNEIKINKQDGSSVLINQVGFSEKYKLLYDIPEKPLDRIYKLLKSIKDFNLEILNQLNPLDLKMLNVLRSIKDERDEVVIERIEKRIGSNIAEVDSYRLSISNVENNLKNLENHSGLTSLKRNLIRFNQNENEYEKIVDDLKKLKPTGNKKIVIENIKIIKELKNEIRDFHISNLLIYCKEEMNENKYSKYFVENFSLNDVNLFNYLFENSESIIDDLLVCNQENISKFLKSLTLFKDVSLKKAFRDLKSNFNEVDFKLVKSLKSDFLKYKEYEETSEVISNLFDKNSDEILEELIHLEKKYAEVDEINNIQKELNSTLDQLISKVNKAWKLSKKLFREINKNNRGPNKQNVFDKTLEKKNNLNESIQKQGKEIQILRNTLEKNGISLFELNKLNRIDVLTEKLFIENKYCRGQEKEKIEECKGDIKNYDRLIFQLEKIILDDEVKFKVENSKQSSVYTQYHRKIQMFSNKLSFFTKYLMQKNSLIEEDGGLKITNSEDNIAYMKIIGEFVASLMGKKIIYQNNTVEIDYIDYSNKTPYFVTPDNKRIAFSDFSGGQGSSNYLKAKLNINEERKFIVLIDEIANMDDQSLDLVISRLKELDENNKLLLAILVEPVKEKNIFRIKTH